MNDLNFFEGLVDKRELKPSGSWIYVFLVGALSLLLVGYIGYNSVVIKRQKEIVSSLRQVVENPEVVSRVATIKEKQAQVTALKESVARIEILNTSVSENKKDNDILLEQINQYMPNNIFLSSINIEKENIYITGISKDRWSIPEFQKNLEALDNYEEIFVSHITLEDDYYNFSLDITLRGVEEDEELTVEAAQVTTDEGTDQK